MRKEKSAPAIQKKASISGGLEELSDRIGWLHFRYFCHRRRILQKNPKFCFKFQTYHSIVVEIIINVMGKAMMQPNDQPEPAKLPYILTLAELSELSGASEKDLIAEIGESALMRFGITRFGVPSQYVRAYLEAGGVNYHFRTLAHINLKGGVGKTTSTVSLATRAVQYGFKTCILDLDSQGSASLAFGIIAEDDDPVFIDVWQQAGTMVMGSLYEIQPGLFLLPSSLENALLDISLANPTQQKRAVKSVCEVLRENGFDLVFIDCPPSLGAAVISSACAADCVIVPVGFDVFSQKGLELTVKEIAAIRETFGLAMPELKVLYNFFDRRVKKSVEIWQQLSSSYGNQLLSTPIRTTTQFTKATHQQATVFASTARSSSKEDYDHCLRELLNIKFNS